MITPTAPALANIVRSFTPPRAGCTDDGNVSVSGCTPHDLYSVAHLRMPTLKSTSAIFPWRPSSLKSGALPAYTSSPVTPADGVCPEYGKYDVTGTLNGARSGA